MTNDYLADWPQLAGLAEKMRQTTALIDAALVTQPHSLFCHDHRFRRHFLRPKSEEHTNARGNGKAILIYEDCPACIHERKVAERSGWLAERDVDRNMLHCTLGNYDPRNESQRAAKESALKFAEMTRGFIVFHGTDKGTGKTHLAVALLRERGEGMFITHANLMAGMSRRYDDRNARDLATEAEESKFLVIDDLGISRGGADVLATIHRILNNRYRLHRRTVITSNLTLPEFQAAIGDRMMDRLTEAALAIQWMEGESFREHKRSQYIETE